MHRFGLNNVALEGHNQKEISLREQNALELNDSNLANSGLKGNAGVIGE